MENYVKSYEPTYGPFVESCRKHGICRTVAYEFAKRGLLKPFRMGSRVYIHYSCLRELPSRIEAASINA